MVKIKALKIKIGEIWDGEKNKSIPVFQTAFEKKSKKGEQYFEIKQQIFVHEYEKKEEKQKATL
jgi:hypothetical protein